MRAIRARGGADRDLIVLLTDAEELNLDGARAFFAAHPWRDRIGAVVNLEARGGGGRAMMFETGPGNAGAIADYARATGAATGGPSSNALAVFVYRLMPNGTDFTVAAAKGLAGINLAFIGRPDQYHLPAATPDALDQGSLQHIGSQALEVTDAWLRAPTLPRATQNAVYADLFGLTVVRHPPVAGWALLAVAALATGFTVWRVRRVQPVRLGAVLRGAADGLWLLAAAVVAGQAVRVLAGPLGGRVQSPETYYTLLRRLPVLEIGVALALSGLALLLIAGRVGGRTVVFGLVAAAALTTALSWVDPVVLGAAAVAVGLGPVAARGGGDALGRVAGTDRAGVGSGRRRPGLGARGGLPADLARPDRRLDGRRGRPDLRASDDLDRPDPRCPGDGGGRRMAAGAGAWRVSGRRHGPAGCSGRSSRF